ncbi:hypothetical protein PsorP6_000836 [Peronosclerospora sorghi]|uniref:Uncharacterized protein n=1 Tax=Peronosclerospora sorghi TaxID=230839 RepID=A0ACC0WXA5_9STRA|nr:hypothetical protein PsorP6_000836 [Peronosclerospora sorghi]
MLVDALVAAVLHARVANPQPPRFSSSIEYILLPRDSRHATAAPLPSPGTWKAARLSETSNDVDLADR